jgi:LmbE family N-acetylglucosaminyl deacetylase
MKILAIGAHADDVELGCGGALLKWAAEGHEITVHVATSSGYASPDGTPIRSDANAAAEARASAARLGAALSIGDFPCLGLVPGEALNNAMHDVIRGTSPDLLLIHWEGDTHSDHRILAGACLHACRLVPTVLAYASNWHRGTTAFSPQVFVDITAELDAKLALIELFVSENGRTGGVWQRWVRSQAESLGFVAAVGAAEGFMVVKQRLDLPPVHP